MHIDWFPTALHSWSVSSLRWLAGKPRFRRKKQHPAIQFDALEDRVLLSGSDLLGGLLNLNPIGVPDTFDVLQGTTSNLTSVLSNDTDPDNDPLTAQLVLGPLHGTVDLQSNGTFTYSPDLTFTGVDLFSYLPNDGTLSGLIPTLVTLNVLPTGTNLPPLGTADTFNVIQNTNSLLSSVLANDSDPNNDILNAQLLVGPLHGVVNLNADGTFSYLPDLGFTGIDVFSYIPNDGTVSGLLPVDATINVLPASLNHAPVANNDNFSTQEGVLLDLSLGTFLDGILANDTDADDNLLIANLVTTTQHGTLTFLPTGTFIYTPLPDFSGIDTFTYQASDLLSSSNVATATITVLPVNDAPIAINDSYSTGTNTALNVSAANGVLANDVDIDSPTLTSAVVSSTTHGILVLNANGSFTYTPAAGFSGTDQFTYRANDGSANSNLATVTISVSGTSNSAPVANADSYNVTEDTPFIATQATGVLANDTDANGDPLTAVLVSQPAHGSVSLAANGSFVYTPSANYSGADSFSYRAADAQSQSNVTTVTLTVAANNDAPLAASDSYFTTGNTTLTVLAANGVLANDSDVDSPTLTAVNPTQPTHGSLTLNPNGSFTYTPGAGFAGIDTFTYRASDGALTSGPTTVSITVSAAANSAPVANNDSYSVIEDTALTATLANGLLANDTDADNNTLTAVVVSQPTHGSLVLSSNGTFVYTPAANFNGSDSFTYQASDGLTTSNVATVTFTVNGTNDAPTAVNDSYFTAANTAVTVTAANGVLVNDTDAENDALTAIAVTQPANGTLTLNANGSLVYTPNAGFIGVDTFTYSASDGSANSPAATVSVTVSAASNSPPVANNDSYSVTEDTALTSTLANGVLTNDSDADGNSLTAILVSQPAHGSVTLSANGTFVYTPNANFTGSDSFTYQAYDGVTNSNVATVAFTVTGTNDAPVAVNDSYATTSNTTLTVSIANGLLANDSDVESANLTAAFVTLPANGTLTLNSNGSFTYVPDTGFAGVDTFTYRDSDGSTNSNTATVSITVSAAANSAPVANNDSYSLNEDEALTVSGAGVLGNDTDADTNPLTAIIVTQPAHGSVTLASNGTFVYTPDPNFSGSDSFTYQASDGLTNSNVAIVSLTIAGSNDAPTAVNDSYFTTAGTTLTVSPANGVLSNDSDPDSANLTASFVTLPSNGTLTLNSNGSLIYTPNAGFTGVDTFTYRDSDGSLNSNVATVSVTVSAVTNTAPVASPDTYSLTEDTTLTTTLANGVLLNDSDADGNTLTANLIAQPAHGSVSLSPDGTFIYVPNANFTGSDSFTYQANDGVTNSNVTTVSLTITGTNDAPTAVNDSYFTGAGTALAVTAANGVLANDSDVDSANLTAAVVMTTPNGTLTLNPNGSLNYTPNAGFTGVDIFTYQASDGAATSNSATVSITVSAPSNSAPVANNDNYSLAEDTTFTATLANGVLLNDTDADGNPLATAIVTQPAHGTVSLSANGTFVYTPNANFTGSDSFTYQANDGTTNSNVATVTFTVTGTNDAPVGLSDSYTTAQGTLLTVTAANGVLANDSDVDSANLTAVVMAQPSNGTLILNGNGSFTYTPNAAFTGVDVFTYQASDGAATSGTTTVSISVTAAPNTAPVANNDSYQLTEDTQFTAQQANGVLANDTDADGNPLTALLVSQPTHGTVTFAANGTFIYTPNANFTGTDSFTYQASDGSANSSVATVNLTVIGTNDAPSSVADSYTTPQGTALTVNGANGVLSNDTDVDSPTITAAIVAQPQNGAVTFNADGSFTYTPNAGFSGVDAFTYRASDGTLFGNTTTVSITVTTIAQTAPVATNDTYQVTEDTPLTVPQATGVLANDTDANGDPLTAQVVTQPSHGTVNLSANGSFVYTPATNYNGSDSFTYQANDGSANSGIATVTFSISAANDVPAGTADSYITNSGTPLNVPAATGVLANDTDADGNPLTAILVTNPAHGTLALNGDGSFVYTPTANFSGPDSFTYRANDGSSNSSIVTVSITVNSTNTAPVSVNDTYTVTEDGVLTVPVATGILNNDSDANGNPLTAAVVSQPLHGSLTLNPDGSFSYTPAADFNGTDTFTYRANDGTVDGNLATVTITVNADGEAPVVTTSTGKQTVKGRKRIVVDPAVNVTDADSPNLSGGSLTVTIQSGVSPNDALGYRHGGANRGRVNSKRTDLRVGKVVIGTISGGLHGSPLQVTFNSNATLDRVKLVMQNLTFRAGRASAGPRVLAFQVKDNTGLLSNIATKEVDVV